MPAWSLGGQGGHFRGKKSIPNSSGTGCGGGAVGEGAAGRCSRGRGKGHAMSVRLSRRAGAGGRGRRAGRYPQQASSHAHASRFLRAIASPVATATLTLGASTYLGGGGGGGGGGSGGGNSGGTLHGTTKRPYSGSLTSGDPNRVCTDTLLWATGAGQGPRLDSLPPTHQSLRRIHRPPPLKHTHIIVSEAPGRQVLTPHRRVATLNPPEPYPPHHTRNPYTYTPIITLPT